MRTLLVLGAASAMLAIAQRLGRRLERRIKRAIDGPAPSGQQPGDAVLALLPGYWIPCVLAGAMSVLFVVAPLVSDDERLRWLGPPLFLLCAAGALFIFGELTTRISLNDEGLTSRGTLHRSVRIRWTDIAAVGWAPMLTSFVIRDHAGAKLRVPILMRGIGTLRERLRKHVAEGIWRDAFDRSDRTMSWRT